MISAPQQTDPIRARNGVAVAFVLNGFLFASWISRLPDLREGLSLSNSKLGLILLVGSLGSLAAMPATGALIERFGTAWVNRAGAGLCTIGLLIAATGVGMEAPVVVAGGLVLYGMGTGSWDVAMNVEGAAVEGALERTIMPRFHAAFSLGTVLGAGLGAAAVAAHLPAWLHLGPLVILASGAIWWATGTYLPDPEHTQEGGAEGVRRSALSAWTEPRTLLIGLMVLALALTEGTANDWLAVALVDGYQAPHWLGVIGFGLFVTAMTLGRLVGPMLLDRAGRVVVLWSTMAIAGLGVCLLVFGNHPVLAAIGIVLWGLGASLGFPVGMSAAADDPVRAAARVSVVSTIGYGAFLAGPPLLGFLGDHFGTLESLLVVAALLIPSALVVPSAREPDRVLNG